MPVTVHKIPVTVIRLVNMRKRLRLEVINSNPNTFIINFITVIVKERQKGLEMTIGKKIVLGNHFRNTNCHIYQVK